MLNAESAPRTRLRAWRVAVRVLQASVEEALQAAPSDPMYWNLRRLQLHLQAASEILASIEG